MKFKKGEFGPEAFMLSVKNRDGYLLSDTDYAQYLLDGSSSVRFLCKLMAPLQRIFSTKDYGSLYNIHALQAAHSRAQDVGNLLNDLEDDKTHDDENENDPSSRGSNENMLKAKEEDVSTDDENNLFNDVEGSLER